MKLQNLTVDRALRTTARIPGLMRLVQKMDLFAAKGLAYHQTYARWRVRRALSRWGEGTPVPAVRGLVAKLDLELPALEEVRAAAARPDDDLLHRALADYLRSRAAPRFFFARADVEPIVTWVNRLDAAGRDRTVHAADAVCRNTFRFRRTAPVNFTGPIDWSYAPAGNTDWMWDLNRHTYFESLGRAYWYTGEERYIAKLGELVADWLARNPAAVTSPAWSSVFEVALRINTWLWALHLARHAPVTDDATLTGLLAGLWTHSRFLDEHIELHAQNNHLLLEAKALAMAGILLPEFREAERWRTRGLEIFGRELQEQVHPDGVHGERASLYHRIIAGELLELTVLADANTIPLPPEIPHRLAAMVEYELWLTKPDGRVPLLGDSALEDVHLRFSGVRGGPIFFPRQPWKSAAPPPGEAEIWLLGPQRVAAYEAADPPPVALESRAFTHGGYYVMRAGSGPLASYGLFNCGPFGYKHHTNHGHADALSLELYAQGQTWLVDPGVYSTHLGTTWRRFFQGTRAHNTVVVDGLDQSHFIDTRRVYRPAQTTLHRWVANDTFDYVAGEHDGYTRLAAPITHRRQVCFVKPDYWIVVDQLDGSGEHDFDLYFHLWPGLDLQVDPDTRVVAATNAIGTTLQIVPVDAGAATLDVYAGETDPPQGWVAIYSGEKLPAPVVRYRRTGSAPALFCTVIHAGAVGAPARPLRVTRLAVTPQTAGLLGAPAAAPDGYQSLAFVVDDGQTVDHVLLAPGAAHTRKRFGGYATDAELLVTRRRKDDGRRQSYALHNGSSLYDQTQPLVTPETHV